MGQPCCTEAGCTEGHPCQGPTVLHSGNVEDVLEYQSAHTAALRAHKSSVSPKTILAFPGQTDSIASDAGGRLPVKSTAGKATWTPAVSESDPGSPKNAPDTRPVKTLVVTLQKLSAAERPGLSVKKSKGRLVLSKFTPGAAVERQNASEKKRGGSEILVVGDVLISLNDEEDPAKFHEILRDAQKLRIRVERRQS